MSKVTALTHEFVEFIPSQLKEGRLYISLEYASAAHKCCCGCGKEVVTPLSPTDWKLIFDGKTVSLDPSIGNWSFPCQSHYWIRNNFVKWAPRWSQKRIDAGRARDKFAKENYFANAKTVSDRVAEHRGEESAETKKERETWRRLREWLGKRM